MRFIGALQGYAAYIEREEEYAPERGAVQTELIEFIRNRYGFQGFPTLSPGTMPLPILLFVGGKFSHGDDAFAVGQFLMAQNADMVVTVTTEQAELVLDDLVSALDEHLGFRLGQATKQKLLLSNVVVEFERGLETMIDKLSKMAVAINHLRPGMPEFNLKRLAFGTGDVLGQSSDPIAIVRHADFLIERRQGLSYEANRYFCSAPMHTADHIRALERIEAIAREGSD
jgi:hypothetical protein